MSGMILILFLAYIEYISALKVVDVGSGVPLSRDTDVFLYRFTGEFLCGKFYRFITYRIRVLSNRADEERVLFTRVLYPVVLLGSAVESAEKDIFIRSVAENGGLNFVYNAFVRHEYRVATVFKSGYGGSILAYFAYLRCSPGYVITFGSGESGHFILETFNSVNTGLSGVVLNNAHLEFGTFNQLAVVFKILKEVFCVESGSRFVIGGDFTYSRIFSGGNVRAVII